MGLPRAYVEIQLRFADTVARAGGLTIDQTVPTHTNFIRRFGFDSSAAAANDPAWHMYIEGLGALTTIGDRVGWTMEVAATCETNLAVHGPGLRSGPFSVEVRDSVARTHFVPHEIDGLSPLHPTKMALRQAELHELFEEVRRSHPEVERVQGASWLYSTRRYRSLFPAAHIATARPPTDLDRFQGSSSWGQFLDHRGQVKLGLRDRFVHNLDTFDPRAQHEVFPIGPMMVDSAIEVFGPSGWQSETLSR